MEPQNAGARCNFANALASLGRLPEAIEQFRAALLLKPQFAEARWGLATVYAQAGQSGAAVAELETLLRQRPNETVVETTLAWLLATTPDAGVRDGARAVQLAEDAAQRTPSPDAHVLSTLAAAYAEVGRFAEATDTAQRALEVAGSSGPGAASLVGTLTERLATYRAGLPYREPRGNSPG